MKHAIKRKIISLILASGLAVSPVVGLPMGVFAWPDHAEAGEASEQFELIQLNKGGAVDAKYTLLAATAPFVFSDFGGHAVLNDSKKVQNPGIVYATINAGVNKQPVYIVADIDGILNFARADVNAAANAAAKEAYTLSLGISASADVAQVPEVVPNHAAYAAGYASAASDAYDFFAFSAYDFASFSDIAQVHDLDQAPNYAFYACEEADGAVNASSDENIKGSWKVAEKACEAARDAFDEAKSNVGDQNLVLEAKLKTAFMAYKVAEAVWTQLGNHADDLAKCKTRANALQELIYDVYGKDGYEA